ncbi:MAG: hypothetical protein A2V90_07535 [Gammaproteobacteria bacterium RBG_16_57_12]|nr:MAG: hypothetical protein A2V90_07535 [Gammaproteobacteria bacterium RBG_16_57_12]
MQVNQDYNPRAYMVRAVTPGQVVISHPLGSDRPAAGGLAASALETLTASLVILPDRLIRDWNPRDFAALQRQHFEFLATLEVEVVLLGTGEKQHFPSGELTGMLASRGIGIEVMNTAAACRTYNFLICEGRRVAAALLIEGNGQ